VGVAMGVVVMLMAFYTKHTIPEVTFHFGAMKLPLYMLIAYLFLMLVGAMPRSSARISTTSVLD
jgi:LPLT family lysophospholipid transporter-like MFS transporter